MRNARLLTAFVAACGLLVWYSLYSSGGPKDPQTAMMLVRDASELGLLCPHTQESCAEMVMRAKANPSLRDAFLRVKAAGSRVAVDNWFHFYVRVGHVDSHGIVEIYSGSSDQEIIDFIGQ